MSGTTGQSEGQGLAVPRDWSPDQTHLDSLDQTQSTATAETDPLGLLTKVDVLRRYSLGQDRIEVWICQTSAPTPSVGEVVSELKANITPYFEFHSRGRYEPVFSNGGIVPRGEDCFGWASTHTSGTANAAMMVSPGLSGGLGDPGLESIGPKTYPGNARWTSVGRGRDFLATVAHEIGHTLSWHHSFTGKSDSQYDNALDVMSGNFGVSDSGRWIGSYPDPYAAAVINIYAAGWIDPESVYIADDSEGVVSLAVPGASGDGMAVIRDGDHYFTLGPRKSGPHDPIPIHWTGVEVYRVSICTDPELCIPGYRRVIPEPPVPFPDWDSSAYERELDHVLRPGDSTTLGGVHVTVLEETQGGFVVAFEPSGIFIDDDGHIFEAADEWLAARGITKGCNPPANDRFCPDDFVTRGQMAAFLVRAFGYSANGGGNLFIDDDSSIFESAIDKLATAGVTKGCNPPANDRFCPDDFVTRGQMAAFLVRAFGYSANGGGNLFIDDDSSIFESAIDKLATAGVTKGCNPPANDRFCPDDFVTRGQMAAFLKRAFTS